MSDGATKERSGSWNDSSGTAREPSSRAWSLPSTWLARAIRKPTSRPSTEPPCLRISELETRASRQPSLGRCSGGAAFPDGSTCSSRGLRRPGEICRSWQRTSATFRTAERTVIDRDGRRSGSSATPAKPLWRRRQMDEGMKVADLGVDPRITAILTEQGIEDLYPPQERAMPIALEGKSLVLAIPTASGKSLVAYLAVLKHVLNGGKAMYIVPLRALAAEKYDDLKAFEPLGIRVGISMGDYDSPDPTLGRYDVIVSTSERADSLLRHRADWLARLPVVVAGEGHLINDADRGPTLEVTLAKMRQVNPKLQIIALSATIRNSAELAAWLKAEHIRSDWRPVPLKSGVMFNGTVLWTDRKTTQFNANEDDLSGLVEDIIDTGGQALIFVNTRKSTEALAKALIVSVKPRLKEKELAVLKKMSE